MKYSPRFTYTFTPGSSTLDLSAAANAFAIKGLLAVVNTTVGATIYAIGTSGLGYNSLSGGNILTLQASMTGMASTDTLIFFYDDATTGVYSGSTAIGARADGFLNVKADPTPMLTDTFETLDTVNTWTTGGSVTPTASLGSLTCPAGTTANAASWLKSQPKFQQSIAAYLQYVAVVQLEAGVITGNQRFWGLGVITAPTLTVPITNGAVFEIDNVAGALLGSVYSNGVRSQSITLVRPSDGGLHRYSIYLKTSRVYFEVDNVTVGSISFPNPATAAFNVVIGSVNGASALGTAAVLSSSLQGVGDTARAATQISDGVYPWREATVKPASTAAAATDTALVISLSPNSPITPPTITKGTQGSTGLSVQDLKDAGRTAITAYSEGIAGTTTETLFALQLSSGFATVGSTTSYTVPAGKTLRLTAITITYVSSTTALNTTRVRIRVNPSGSAVITSTIVWSSRVGVDASVGAALQSETVHAIMPDGLEIPSGGGVAVSHVESVAVGTIDFSLMGFIY